MKESTKDNIRICAVLGFVVFIVVVLITTIYFEFKAADERKELCGDYRWHITRNDSVICIKEIVEDGELKTLAREVPR